MGLVFPLSAGRVGMRGLFLLLPVLLVLFLAGSARTEEQSSLVEEAKLASNLLPLEEKVVERETREAERKREGKKTQKKKKKNAAEKKKRNNKTLNKKKSDRIEKRKKSRRLKNLKKNDGKKSDNKKTAKSKKSKRTNNNKNRKKSKGNGKRKQQTAKDKKKKKKKQKKKDKMKRRKNKNVGRQGPAGGDWSSCGTSGVNDTCLLNAVNALNFEKNQIQNFFKQKARLENQNKVTGNKKGKKGEFEDAAKYMLTAIGGNISSPTCGENTTRTQRAAADAVATYNKSKVASDDCRSNSAYTSDGAAACNCWEKAAIGITIAKAEGCTKKGKEQAQAVKKQKTKCISAFSKCKKAEDAAVALIYTCMSGEVNTNASSAEKDLAKGPLLFV